MNNESQWPEDQADWPQTASAVQGGVVPAKPAQLYSKTRQVTVDDLVKLQERCDELLSAAKAVVERWDSPLWKDLPPTADAIARLRDAVNKLEGSAE